MERKDFLFASLRTIIGCALFAVGFNIFLAPSELNAGGISGLAMVVDQVLKTGSVGSVAAVMNVPLFAIAGLKIGKKFFWGSFVGMAFLSLFIDLLAFLPQPELDPLLGALYGGVICGFGLGQVFAVGMSTGGSDIIVRLLKKKWPYLPIGFFTTAFDAFVAILTGVVFQDLTKSLYSGITIFITGQMINVVVYRFDYSKVVWIISKKHAQIAHEVGLQLHRGSTYLHGQGAYSGNETQVILTAVKKQQIAELKDLVAQIDPEAFVIVQEAHQVLGDGFLHYSKDSL